MYVCPRHLEQTPIWRRTQERKRWAHLEIDGKLADGLECDVLPSRGRDRMIKSLKVNVKSILEEYVARQQVRYNTITR